MTTAQIKSLLLSLLPKGLTSWFDFSLGSFGDKVLEAAAEQFVIRVSNTTDVVEKNSDPLTVLQSGLTDWEIALGIDVFPWETIQDRQAAIVSRLREYGASTLPNITASLEALLGTDVRVVETTRHQLTQRHFYENFTGMSIPATQSVTQKVTVRDDTAVSLGGSLLSLFVQSGNPDKISLTLQGPTGTYGQASLAYPQGSLVGGGFPDLTYNVLVQGGVLDSGNIVSLTMDDVSKTQESFRVVASAPITQQPSWWAFNELIPGISGKATFRGNQDITIDVTSAGFPDENYEVFISGGVYDNGVLIPCALDDLVKTTYSFTIRAQLPCTGSLTWWAIEKTMYPMHGALGKAIFGATDHVDVNVSAMHFPDATYKVLIPGGVIDGSGNFVQLALDDTHKTATSFRVVSSISTSILPSYFAFKNGIPGIYGMGNFVNTDYEDFDVTGLKYLFGAGAAGKSIMGDWTITVTNNDLVTTADVPFWALFTEGIGRDAIMADGLGAAAFRWNALFDPALVTHPNWVALHKAIKRWSPAHTEGKYAWKMKYAGLNSRGAWDGANSYAWNDWVVYAGDKYICTHAVTPTVTPPSQDTLHWSIIDIAICGNDNCIADECLCGA